MKRIVCNILCVIAISAVLCGCGGKGSGTATADETSVSSLVQKSETFLIETPYGMLKLPEKWRKQLDIETKNEDKKFTLSFSSDGVALFDILTGDASGDLLGTLKTDNGDIEFRAVKYKLDESAENYETLAELQGGVDFIVENLQKDYDFTAE